VKFAAGLVSQGFVMMVEEKEKRMAIKVGMNKKSTSPWVRTTQRSNPRFQKSRAMSLHSEAAVIINEEEISTFSATIDRQA